jgi:hypothetical protein
MIQNAELHRLNGLSRIAAVCRRLTPRRGWRSALALAVATSGLYLGVAASPAAAARIKFDLERSTAVQNAGCFLDAKAHATVVTQGEVEVMTLTLNGAPPRTGFDVFITQLPNNPFGLAWYQGDLQTDAHGNGTVVFRGRFNIETFIVATGSGAAPVVHDDGPFPDANSNPVTAPVHTYHVGIWFDSPEAAQAAGCPGTVTPFNGEHNAGIQAMSTRNAPDDFGPLRRLE